ncbi:hypothetical protein QTQ03_29365 [Micromonospora sp. WMMA1363]|uniref:hypothetical protein n=1 Tax=Micromonospora sp. WMMA1363 TaxID=3053985 RepID=UPI00259CE5E6|nr:hypothetical protein [Micromonospora sp. WMMA1363]MDM4723489.1 hypothetical protein [Micromonospora sp. WMMA1363]
MPHTDGTDAIKAARRVFIRHKQCRMNISRCRFCGGAWRQRDGQRLVDGCAARQLVAGLLVAAGQIDAVGHLTPPPVLLRLAQGEV